MNRLMLESGLRFEHALRMLAGYNPEGTGLFNDKVYPRLYCNPARGFCRYLIGLDSGVKRAWFAYFSLETGELIREIAPWTVHRRSVERHVKRHRINNSISQCDGPAGISSPGTPRLRRPMI